MKCLQTGSEEAEDISTILESFECRKRDEKQSEMAALKFYFIVILMVLSEFDFLESLVIKKRSPAFSFLKEPDEPIYKFVKKIVGAAQMGTKMKVGRVRNTLRKTEQLENDIVKKIRIRSKEIT